MKHEDVWRALDTLAAEKGLSPSGLARAAGLDPTTFNRSKRACSEGRLRWPSMESLSRVLVATGASLENFTALVGGARALSMGRGHRARHLPLVALSSMADPVLFDADGFPSGIGWDETEVPQPGDPHGYAVRVDIPALEPAFRHGGTLILSPEAPVRPGDRVILRPWNAVPRVGILAARSPRGAPGRTIVEPLDGQGGPVPSDGFMWMHRIMWASF
ncbi:helix-turn-helix transcriptional regulator [Rhizosaccharibacter radicis]|uniref:Helix-turn-helix transcriptional regulator n=1 Tax=Rhizosaccharibacter radicis TaxID=2782605 RepID=A0ABT1VY04_9PROT|nr:helix-turn-helix transcriptional regulator [Acetobacteraceae bacterium KSS12]